MPIAREKGEREGKRRDAQRRCGGRPSPEPTSVKPKLIIKDLTPNPTQTLVKEQRKQPVTKAGQQTQEPSNLSEDHPFKDVPTTSLITKEFDHTIFLSKTMEMGHIPKLISPLPSLSQLIAISSTQQGQQTQ